MESIIESILKAICEAFALPLAEDALTGKLTTTHTATVAESDSVIQKQGADALAAFDKRTHEIKM